MNCLTWLIVGFLGWFFSVRLFGPWGGMIAFLVLLYLFQRSASVRWTGGDGWSVDSVEDLDPLLGLFMALVRQNPEHLREIHAQAALQVLHEMTRPLGIPYPAVTERFKHWESDPIPVKDFALELKDLMPRSVRRRTLQSLMYVSLADGTIDEDEEGILRYISDLFEVPEHQFDRFFREARRVTGARRRRRQRTSRRSPDRSDVKQAYETLNLSPDASEEDVKKQYRKLARRHHPDSLDDDSEEARERAKEKMMDINRAYRTIQEAT